MTQILITNCYSARNKGDAGIVEGMIASLSGRATFREARFRLSSADPVGDADRYKHPVVDSFHSLTDALPGPRWWRFLVFLFGILPITAAWGIAFRVCGRRLRLPAFLRSLTGAYADADLVIAAGGGYLYATSALRGNVVLLMTVYSFAFGVLLGKPVYLYAQSVGPFALGVQARLVRSALRRVRRVQAREQATFRLLESWRLPVPLDLTADPAFLVRTAAPSAPESGGRRSDAAGAAAGKTVGITVRKWFRDPARQQAYETVMARFADWLLAEAAASVVFVPQVTFAAGGDDDRAVAREIRSRMTARENAELVDDELTPAGILALCGRLTAFVGTRMHSNIYAVSMGVPALAIGYQPKTAGIMDQLGLSEFVLPIDRLTVNALRASFERLLGQREVIRETLRKRLPLVRRAAEHSSLLIEQDYTSFRESTCCSPVPPPPRQELLG